MTDEWEKFHNLVQAAANQVLDESKPVDLLAEMERLAWVHVTLPTGEVRLDSVRAAEKWADVSREIPDIAREERLEALRKLIRDMTGFEANGAEACLLMQVAVSRANRVKKNNALLAGWLTITDSIHLP